jgi:hypothetical protein
MATASATARWARKVLRHRFLLGAFWLDLFQLLEQTTEVIKFGDGVLRVGGTISPVLVERFKSAFTIL